MTKCTPPADDPLFYKLLAILLFFSALTFLVTYLLDAYRARKTHEIEPFAWALIGLALALVIYASATLLRQALGGDYIGRDFIRSAASAMLSAAMLTISRVAHRNRPPL